MICKVRRTVDKHGMLDRGDTVIVGISGGADSCALLDVLCELQADYGLHLLAAHVNHGIRGAQAQRDEDFVKAFCEARGVPLKTLHCDVPRLSKERGVGLEACGRQVRYDFFESIAPDAKIATAHTSSDACETLLLHLTRGAGLRGMCGIPYVRGRIIRPLLDCTRAEIEAYCAGRGITYMTDETNEDPAYARNRIRRQVIPSLRQINPSLEEAAARLAAAAQTDEAYFSSQVSEILAKAAAEDGYIVQELASLHPALQTRAVAAILERETGQAPERTHVLAVCGILEGGRTQVLGGTAAECRNGLLTFGEPERTPPWQRDFSAELPIITPKKTVRAVRIHKKAQETIQFVHKNVLDSDRTVGTLAFRSRMPGDKIRIAGRGGTKTLKKLLTEAKIQDKNAVVVLADAEGPVWVEGFGCAERCKIEETTKTILKIYFDGEDFEHGT